MMRMFRSAPRKARSVSRILLPLLLALVGATASAKPAVFEDSIAQRVQACVGCHGAQGRAGPDGYYPRLAGKPAGYLYNQLLSFRDQRRLYRPMNQLLARLPDAYLLEMAQHFASLDVPYPAPPPSPVTPAVRQRGQQLVLRGDPARELPACVSCHGDAMTGFAPNVPGLLGLPRDYLNSQLGAWRTGQRHAHAPDCMAKVAQRLAADDISAASSWLAAQPVPRNGHPVTALPKAMPLNCGTAPQAGGAQ